MRRFAILALVLAAGCGGEQPKTGAPVPIPPSGPPRSPALRGVVLDDLSRPVPGATVRAYLPYHGGHQARTEGLSAETAKDGTFVIDIVKAFDPQADPPVIIVAGKTGYVPFRNQIPVYCRLTGLDVELRLILGGAVTGRILDGAGAPVRDAAVFMLPEDIPGLPRSDMAPSAATGEDGSFTLSELPPRSLDLVVRHPGSLPYFAGPFPVRPGETLDAGEHRLAPGATIRGTVRTPQGEPVRAAIVRAFRNRHYRDYAIFGRRAAAEAGARIVTADDGAFALDGLADAAYTVEAEAPGHVSVNAGATDVRPGGDPLAFVLAEETWLELTVVDGRTAAPLPAYELFLAMSGSGGVTRREIVKGRGVHRVPVNRGDDLALEISAEGFEVGTRLLKVDRPGATALRFPLSPR